MESISVYRFLGPFVAAFAASLASPAAAQSPQSSPPQFAVPVACRVHHDCWIANYFDNDPGPGTRDYTGGSRTYDGHAGTDFAVRDIAAMNGGVAVLAAADGKVRARRDGMADVHFKVIGRATINGRECGNGVVIDHAPGWASQYCHMRKGSVRVERGQSVKTGDVLGFIGHSGFAAFPHLHFNVLREGEKVDPFAAGGTTSLWTAAAMARLRYEAVSIYAAGFRSAVPEPAKVKIGVIEDQALSDTSPAIVFWIGIFGVRSSDTIHLSIEAPDGRTFAEREVVQQKNQARRFLWIGRKRPTVRWPAGEYVGRATVTPGKDDGRMPKTREATVSIAAAGPD